MRLLKYPRVVQEEIFSNMEHETIFPLSLTSRNILKVLKQFNWKPIEVTFVFDSKKFQIYFGDSTAPLELTPKMFDLYHNFPKVFYYMEDYGTKTVYNFETNFGSGEEIVKRLYNHLFELFQKCQSLKFGAHFDTSDMNHYVPIRSLEIATLRGVSADDITTFMKNHLNLKFLVFVENPKNSWRSECIGGIPDIISVRNMRAVCFERNFLVYMYSFKGVNAYFCGITKANHIHEFVNGWLHGKFSENLKFIRIEQQRVTSREEFRPDLLENYRQNQWDLNRMPLEYELDEGDKYYRKFPGPFKMENAVYVQRESDGKILSLQNTLRIFIGCVWNQEDVFR